MARDSSAAVKSELLDSCGQARVGEAAPWLAGWTLDEQVFNIRKPFENENTRRLALVFWATWCKPCRKGIEWLEEASDSLMATGVTVVLVNEGEPLKKVTGYWKRREPSFMVVLDPYSLACERYLSRAGGGCPLPFTALIDRDGYVERLIGAEGDDYIDLLLAQE
jgi:thiol-disulfide isomerase/thioredoxin